jgi:hypothetical protein
VWCYDGADISGQLEEEGEEFVVLDGVGKVAVLQGRD